MGYCCERYYEAVRNVGVLMELIQSTVVSRNHLTSNLYVDVSKLSDRDIRGIIRQWKGGKSVHDLAEYHQVSRQRICQIISFYRQNGYPPCLRPRVKGPPQSRMRLKPSCLLRMTGIFPAPTVLKRKSRKNMASIFHTIRSTGSFSPMGEW